MPKIPVDVPATGPKVISVGARHAERLSFTLGADVNRLLWAICTAKAARRDADLDPEAFSYGVYIDVVAHPDRAVARELAATRVTMISRCSMLHGQINKSADEEQAATLTKLAEAYDYREHGSNTARHRSALDAGYIDEFAIVGPPEHCVKRLNELDDVGMDRVVVLAALATEGPDLDLSRRLLVDDVLPAFPTAARSPVGVEQHRAQGLQERIRLSRVTRRRLQN